MKTLRAEQSKPRLGEGSSRAALRARRRGSCGAPTFHPCHELLNQIDNRVGPPIVPRRAGRVDPMNVRCSRKIVELVDGMDRNYPPQKAYEDALASMARDGAVAREVAR